MSYSFNLTKPQVVEVFKKQARKNSKPLLIGSIVLLCVSVIIALLYFFVEKTSALIDGVKFLSFIGLFSLLIVIIARCSAPKNAEKYFEYNSTNDVIEYCYELTEVDFIISQPALGNVWHYKYSMVFKVVDLGGYVAVTLASNQFLPIPTTEHTAPLIATLKSVASSAKK